MHFKRKVIVFSSSSSSSRFLLNLSNGSGWCSHWPAAWAARTPCSIEDFLVCGTEPVLSKVCYCAHITPKCCRPMWQQNTPGTKITCSLCVFLSVCVYMCAWWERTMCGWDVWRRGISCLFVHTWVTILASELIQSTISRILDILILQDKTLFCACVDNFKQNGSFWRHCACADNFKQNGVFWRQHLPVVRLWTWSKYNKHHHDLKNQLCRFIDMYIGKIFWPTAPCRGCPEKEIWGQG